MGLTYPGLPVLRLDQPDQVFSKKLGSDKYVDIMGCPHPLNSNISFSIGSNGDEVILYLFLELIPG